MALRSSHGNTNKFTPFQTQIDIGWGKYHQESLMPEPKFLNLPVWTFVVTALQSKFNLGEVSEFGKQKSRANFLIRPPGFV
jgi:hypothetical protein